VNAASVGSNLHNFPQRRKGAKMKKVLCKKTFKDLEANYLE